MLVVRQRALCNRRANRENLKDSQQGFFGRTNPGKIDEKRPPSNRNYRDPGLSVSVKERSEPEASKTSNGRNHFNGLESPTAYPRKEHQVLSPTVNAHSIRRPKEKNKVMATQNPITSMLSRIRPRRGILHSRRGRDKSETRAVINRIAAVRAVRLRAYGDINSSNNYAADAAGTAHRLEQVLSKERDTFDDFTSNPVPGYQYYPHNDSNEPRSRDDDQSLSTHESSAQDYLSID